MVLGTWQSRRVAVKILSQRDQLIFDREVAASDRLDHPNIVKVLTIFKGTVVPGFRAFGSLTAESALNPGSALFPVLDLEHFEL